MFSCETQHKRKHMQYAAAATNNARAAGGTVVRQGRVSYLLESENHSKKSYIYRDTNSNIVSDLVDN